MILPFIRPTQLPSLGLNKHKDDSLKNQSNNPFSVQRDTEKLLMIRERERLERD